MRKYSWLFLGVLLFGLGTYPVVAIADDAPDAGASATMPQREHDLIDILIDARKQYQTGRSTNPAQDARIGMQVRVINFMRQSQVAQDWVGTVKTRGTTPEGNAWITIEIADGITISTWTSHEDDIDSGTLLRPHTPIFATAQQAKIGSTVIFSGTILKSVLASDDDMVLRPRFIARFSGLRITQ